MGWPDNVVGRIIRQEIDSAPAQNCLQVKLGDENCDEACQSLYPTNEKDCLFCNLQPSQNGCKWT